MSYDVFISHSSKDKMIADAACHSLEQNGVRCWIAPRDVRGGYTYGEEIITAIEECAVFVLIFSKNSNSSEDVKNEIQNAFTNNKIIIPCRIDDCAMDKEVQYFLSRKHWIDVYPNNTVFDQLVKSTKNALAAQNQEPVPNAKTVDIQNETFKIVIIRNGNIIREYPANNAKLYITQELFSNQSPDPNLWNLNVQIAGSTPSNLFRNNKATCEKLLLRIVEASNSGLEVFEIDWGNN